MASQNIEMYFRFCPRCGGENSQPGTVPFRCAYCQFAQFFGPVAAVGALIVDDKGQLLMVRRAKNPGKGRWGLPGGFVDRDETIEQALARETMEETGLRIIQARYLTTFPNDYDYRGIVMAVIDQFFVCRAAQPHKIQLDRDELDHFEWVRPSGRELENMAFLSNRLAIEKWLAE